MKKAVPFFLSLALCFVAKAQVYKTIASGNWSNASIWQDGFIPPAENPAGGVINILHEVNFNLPENLIKNYGTFRIESSAGVAARLNMPSGAHFENYSTGKVYITNAHYSQYRFAGGGNSGSAQGGTFKNYGGMVRVVNSSIEVAQDWITESGGSRYFENSCLATGQNYSNSGTPDTLINGKLSIGWHGSGSFDLNSGNMYFQNIAVALSGTSGNFKLNSGTANGSINYITLKNTVTGNIGSGEIFASSSLNNAPGLSLNAYCVSSGSKYIPNGKFSGAQAFDCTVNPDVIDCVPLPMIVLPVKFNYFKLRLDKNNNVDLEWATTSEINASHFVIEKSYDGVNFEEKGMVMAYANFSEIRNYSFRDNITPSKSKLVYYRLRTVDTDGSFSYSAIHTIRISSRADTEMKLLSYPNPASTELRLTVPEVWQNKKVTFEILSAAGQIAKKRESADCSQTETINVSGLAPGFYLVRATCNAESVQQKIIKQ